MRAACAMLSTRTKHEIEPPCADAARFEIEAQLVAKFADDALQILGIGDRFGKTQFGARHFGRYERRQRLIGVAERLIETQQHFAAKALPQTAARFARELRHTLDTDVDQGRDTLRKKAGGRDRQTGDRFRRAARRNDLRLAITRERPGAARRIGNRGLGRDAFRFEPLAEIIDQSRFALKQMRRARDIDEDAVGRIRRDQRRISDAPEREAHECRFVFVRRRVDHRQIGNERLRVRDGHAAAQIKPRRRRIDARDHAALPLHHGRHERFIPWRRVFASPAAAGRSANAAGKAR